MNFLSRAVHRSLARYFWQCARNLEDELVDHCMAEQARIEIFQHRASIHANLAGIIRVDKPGEPVTPTNVVQFEQPPRSSSKSR